MLIGGGKDCCEDIAPPNKPHNLATSQLPTKQVGMLLYFHQSPVANASPCSTRNVAHKVPKSPSAYANVKGSFFRLGGATQTSRGEDGHCLQHHCYSPSFCEACSLASGRPILGDNMGISMVPKIPNMNCILTG